MNKLRVSTTWKSQHEQRVAVILRTIDDLTPIYGRPPTRQEIWAHGLSEWSFPTVAKDMVRMERAGMLERIGLQQKRKQGTSPPPPYLTGTWRGESSTGERLPDPPPPSAENQPRGIAPTPRKRRQ